MGVLLALLKTMRPRQWTKNILFVFPGIVFGGQLLDVNALSRVIVTAILLILMSGTVYIINDLVDVENDRQHPKKKNRPIAAGTLPIQIARLAAVSIPVVTLAFAFAFDTTTAVILIIYLSIQVAYSFYFKHVVLLDVLFVTAGFVLRIAAGVAVINVNFSPWLYACGGLLALLLVIGKRRQDLVELQDQAAATRPIYQEYNLALLDEMLRLVMTSALITYILYTLEAPTIKLSNTNLALITVPFVMYGLFRYLYLVHVRGEGSAPEELLLKDRMLQIAIALWGIVFVLLLYVVPGTT